MQSSKLNIVGLLAVAVLASAATSPALSATPQPRGKRRPQVKEYYGGMTKEQQAWNAAVEAKRKAKKGTA